MSRLAQRSPKRNPRAFSKRDELGCGLDRALSVRARVDVMSIVHHDDVAVGGALGEPARESIRPGGAPPVPVPHPEAPAGQRVAAAVQTGVELTAAPAGVRPEERARSVTAEPFDLVCLIVEQLPELVARTS